MSVALSLQGGGDVGGHPLGTRHGRVPELPELAVASGVDQRGFVIRGERLEADAVALERDRLNVDHRYFFAPADAGAVRAPPFFFISSTARIQYAFEPM